MLFLGKTTSISLIIKSKVVKKQKFNYICLKTIEKADFE
jgi:hypothetical protein